MAPEVTLRDATPDDVPAVLRFVRDLAEYERLLQEVTATEADFHRLLFGPKPSARTAIDENRPRWR